MSEAAARVVPPTETNIARLSGEKEQKALQKPSLATKRHGRRKPVPCCFLAGICFVLVGMLVACHFLGLDQRRPPPAITATIAPHCKLVQSPRDQSSPLMVLARATRAEAMRFKQAHEKRRKLERASLSALASAEAPNGVNATLRSRHADAMLRALHDGQCVVATPELAARMATAWRALSDQRARMPRPAKAPRHHSAARPTHKKKAVPWRGQDALLDSSGPVNGAGAHMLKAAAAKIDQLAIGTAKRDASKPAGKYSAESGVQTRS